MLEMVSKEEARAEIFRKRNGLSSRVIADLNSAFYDNFLSCEFFRVLKSKTIAGYCAFEKECDIFKVLEFLSKDNSIALPSIVQKNESMVFKKWDCDCGSLTVNGCFSRLKILEPKDSAIIKPDIVFVPAVAVDIFGNRAGYGGGYYDKTLEKTDCIKIATVFDFQVFDKMLQNNKTDVKLDYILTENRFIKIRGKI